MSETDLSFIFGPTTYPRIKQNMQAQQAKTLGDLAAANLNNATADQTRFNVSKGESMLPYDIKQKSYDTSDDVQKLNKQKLQLDVNEAISKTDDATIKTMINRGVQIQKAVNKIAYDILVNGGTPQQAAQAVLDVTPEKDKSTVQQMITNYLSKNKSVPEMIKQLEQNMSTIAKQDWDTNPDKFKQLLINQGQEKAAGISASRSRGSPQHDYWENKAKEIGLTNPVDIADFVESKIRSQSPSSMGQTEELRIVTSPDGKKTIQKTRTKTNPTNSSTKPVLPKGATLE